MKVSDFSVKAADRVKKHGVPQLVDAVAAGKVSVSAAARIAKLPVEQQEAVVRAIEGGLALPEEPPMHRPRTVAKSQSVGGNPQLPLAQKRSRHLTWPFFYGAPRRTR
jgi:hypothetical protein